ncbi:hypothetical protein N0V86_002348 [Didymella sp. IMI 355093]|nr:hypothetical protein N0V86_002348 [Didymella sp. IMI 355093]
MSERMQHLSMETAVASTTPEAPEAPLATLTVDDPYIKHPIDPLFSQIRVFTLLPSSDPQAPLQGQLRVEDLSPKPVGYEALSEESSNKEDLTMTKGWWFDNRPWMDSEIDFSISSKEALDAHNANESGYNVCQDFILNFSELPRYVFITDSNIVGAAAQEVVTGDNVALLDGAKCPLVLRRQKDMSHQIIGVAVADYIDAKSQLDIGGPKTEFTLS